MLAIFSSWRRIAQCLPVTAIVAVLSVSPAVAQQQPQTLTVVLTELQFNPNTITLTVGQPVQLNVQNKGLADHNLASRDEPDSIPISNVTYQKADNDPRQLRMYEASNILDTDVNSGHTSVVTFTPTKVGTFRFISNAGDDEINGMLGSFVVVGPAGPAAPAPVTVAPATVTTAARAGQPPASPPAATQAMFNAVWG